MKTKYVYILMLGLLSVFSTGCEDRLDIAKQDRKSTRLNSSHRSQSRMPSSA